MDVRSLTKLNFDLVGTYFDVAVGLVWQNDSASYADGNVAAGKATHSRAIEGNGRDKEGYPVPPVWELGVRLTIPPHKK